MTTIKQRKITQDKLVHQEDRIVALTDLLSYYKDITETVREPFLILDKELHVVTANHAFYRTFKVNKRDTQHKRIYELGNNQWNIPELRELLERILPKHRVFNNFSVTHDFPVLGQRTMLLNARQVDSKQLILLAMEDVSAQQKLKGDSDEMTANLIRQRDKLQKLNSTKDEFVSMASHQLRTPATVIKQYAAMLSEGYAGKLSGKQKDMANIIYESNERQLEIIEDLLRVARVDDGKVYLEKSACNMTQILEVVIEKQAILFKSRGQTVTLQKPPKKIMAMMDHKLMSMVFENLLDNAGKYSESGSKIKITMSQTDKFTKVSVQDSGVGIARVDYKKLYKKFSRIDNSLSIAVAGTGLGLYWVKKILDLHEGSIEVESKLNKGSTFMVKLPIAADYSLEPTPS
ncbi:MAG: HAMP domain-containing sensor histidine kinase [Candidatus Saccharimonadales bacterium]